MPKIGLIAPATPGHLNPMTSLGWELMQRGHSVTYFGIEDAKHKITSLGLDFKRIGEAEYPQGKLAEIAADLGKLKGSDARKFTVEALRLSTAVILRDTPSLISDEGIALLLVDQVSPAGGSVAEFLDLPFITICSALMQNQEDVIPPSNTLWPYNPTNWARWRNQLGYFLFNRTVTPMLNLVNEYRKTHHLPSYHSFNEFHSRFAQIVQTPIEFEFPRSNLPDYVHFTGPLTNPVNRQSIDFPFDQLDGRPLIYASLGTLQNRLPDIFEKIATACSALNAQLVISLGGSALPSPINLPGAPIVVRYSPQLELLKRAKLVITHAGLNTVMESLSNGVPMVAIPITNDQPGIASRLCWSGVGKAITLNRLTSNNLRRAILSVLNEHRYQKNALKLQNAILRCGGLVQAANIVEKVLTARKSVQRYEL